MANVTPENTPVESRRTKDDPLKPYKALVGAIGAGAMAAVGAGLDLPTWLLLVLIFVGGFAGTYVTPNPKV